MDLNQMIAKELLEAVPQPATTVADCCNFPWQAPDCFLKVFQMCQCPRTGQKTLRRLVWFWQRKQTPSFVLRQQQAPAKSRKFCGQWCWPHTLASFHSFRVKITRRKSNLEWKSQSKQLHGTNADRGSRASLGTLAALLKAYQRGVTHLQRDVTWGPPTPKDRGFSKTNYTVLAPFPNT